MRRLDVLLFSAAVFGVGGLAYAILLFGVGMDSTQAGIWSQVVLVGVVVMAWVGSYLFRAFTQTMTYSSFTIANYRQRGETENAATLYHFGNTVNLNQFFLEVAVLLLLFLIIKSHKTNP